APLPPERVTEISAADQLAAGKALREKAPHESHGSWKRDKDSADPLALLRASDKFRLAKVLPVRYGRMLQSPFTFYRGSAAVMAADLARTPSTGLRVQACGDCHLMNFGGFATPERNIIFDVNDLDETLPAPWEWDVKRLVASFVLAARSNKLSDAAGCDAAITCAQSYRRTMRQFSKMDVLETWYHRVDDEAYLAMLPRSQRAVVKRRIAKATARSSHELVFPKLVEQDGGVLRIHDAPPTIFHEEGSAVAGYMDMVASVLEKYRETLSEDRRILFD